MSARIEYKCEMCGKLWFDYQSNHRRYCSKQCANKAKETVRPNCKVCGKPVRTMHNIYCSKDCSNGDREYGITSYSGLYYRIQHMFPEPQPCVDCGKPGEHRHHEDYNKPFEIVWLCESCHHSRHPRNDKVRTIKIHIPA